MPPLGPVAGKLLKLEKHEWSLGYSGFPLAITIVFIGNKIEKLALYKFGDFPITHTEISIFHPSDISDLIIGSQSLKWPYNSKQCLLMIALTILMFYFMLYGGMNMYFTAGQIFHYSEKYNCYTGVSMILMLFYTLAYFNKCNVTFLKLGTNIVNITTSWCYCFLHYNVFGCFSLKETEKLLNLWCKFKIYFTRENIAPYDHKWNKFLSYTNIQ